MRHACRRILYTLGEADEVEAKAKADAAEALKRPHLGELNKKRKKKRSLAKGAAKRVRPCS
jgi:hypothetical protein